MNAGREDKPNRKRSRRWWVILAASACILAAIVWSVPQLTGPREEAPTKGRGREWSFPDLVDT
jgi:hypothetical protein